MLACSAAPGGPVGHEAHGSSGSPGGAPGVAGAPSPPNSCTPVTERRVRRLSHEEYELVVADLFGARQPLVSWSSPDVLVQGFDTNADALTISSGSLEDFTLTAEVLAGAADVATLAPCAADTPPVTCAGDFATSFAERAFGRPIAPGERQRFEQIYRTGATPDDHDAGIRLVIEAVLVSPHFLYRTELGDGPPGANGEISLTPVEVANALSFAITGTRPDAALRTRATSDPAFLSEGVLREEVTRLAAEPRARQRLARFLRSWLGVRDLRAVNKIPILFPDFSPDLKAALEQELTLFLDRVLAEGGTVTGLFASPLTFANTLVMNRVYAADYAGRALPVVPADGSFVPIPLDAARRRGILSLGGWLAAHSPVHRSSPVDRGLAVRSRLFCQSLPPPPPGALFMAPRESDGVTTTRQKFEAHASNPDCKGCHVMMDPIGFGLEMMDGMGRYRSDEAGLPLDSRGMLTDTDVDGAFQGPAELADKLVQSRELRACLVTQLFRYVEGRDVRPGADDCMLSQLQAAFITGDGSVAELLSRMVLGSALQKRTVEP
jgi:hypothetical protein